MKLLLDTHVLLWAITSPELLSKRVRKALLDESNALWASTASIWEITLKCQAGKLQLTSPENLQSFLETHLRRLGVRNYLAIDLYHVCHLSRLESIHKHPFDRILVAQAIVEGLTLVSRDSVMSRYPVTTLW